MTIPAWHVTTWHPVNTTATALNDVVTHMRHLGTSVQGEPDNEGPLLGQTVWGATIDGRVVGIAWDWGEVRDGVVALSDPMMVLSNLCFVDEAGERLDDGFRVLNLNSAIHQLPWQSAIPPRRTRLPLARTVQPPARNVGRAAVIAA